MCATALPVHWCLRRRIFGVSTLNPHTGSSGRVCIIIGIIAYNIIDYMKHLHTLHSRRQKISGMWTNLMPKFDEFCSFQVLVQKNPDIDFLKVKVIFPENFKSGIFPENFPKRSFFDSALNNGGGGETH